MHAPPGPQTPTVPHIATGVVLKSGIQIGAPEPQSIAPVAHGLPVSQTAPGRHEPQAPAPSQTSAPGPHEVPAGAFTPVSTHVGVGPQLIEPR